MGERILAMGRRASGPQRGLEVDGGSEIARLQALFESGSEFAPGVVERIARGLAEAAMAGAPHQFGKSHQFVDLVVRAAPLGDLVHEIALQRRADAAGRAEAAALVREKAREIAGDLEIVAAGVE